MTASVVTFLTFMKFFIQEKKKKSPLACGSICINMRGVESKFVTGPKGVLFAGFYVHFSARKCCMLLYAVTFAEEVCLTFRSCTLSNRGGCLVERLGFKRELV